MAACFQARGIEAGDMRPGAVLGIRGVWLEAGSCDDQFAGRISEESELCSPQVRPPRPLLALVGTPAADHLSGWVSPNVPEERLAEIPRGDLFPPKHTLLEVRFGLRLGYAKR